MAKKTSLSSYFEQATIVDITDVSDEVLCSYMIHRTLDHKAFFSCVDVEKVKGMKSVPGPFGPGELLIEALRRSGDRVNTGLPLLAKRMREAAQVAVIDCNIHMIPMGDGASEEIKMIRGSYDITTTSVRDAMHAASAIVQMYKPEKISKKGVSGFAPSKTDSKGFMYPNQVANLPDSLVEVYKNSKTVDEVVSNIATKIQSADTPQEYAEYCAILPFVSFMSKCTTKFNAACTKVHGVASPERAKWFRDNKVFPPMYRDTEDVMVRAYAILPKFKYDPKLTMYQAYEYLLNSRAIRGENSKGLSSNTQSYMHGDVPSNYWRAYSMAYNILSLEVGMRRRTAGYPPVDVIAIVQGQTWKANVKALILQNRNVVEIVSTVMPPEENKGYGMIKFDEKGEYLHANFIDRHVTKLKAGYNFSPSFDSLRDLIRDTIVGVTGNKPSAIFHFCFHVIACEEILRTCEILPSAHPHPGNVWIYVDSRHFNSKDFMRKVASKEDFCAREVVFATRLILSNAYKNYYPFHRAPFVKFDVALPKMGTIYLTRDVVAKKKTLNKLLYDEDEVPVAYDAELEELYRAAEIVMEKKFSSVLQDLEARADVATNDLRSKMAVTPATGPLSTFFKKAEMMKDAEEEEEGEENIELEKPKKEFSKDALCFSDADSMF